MSADTVIERKHRGGAPDTACAGSFPLAERDLALAQVEDAFQRLLNGRMAMAIVQGTPGIGKSRLIAEFRQTLPRDQVRVIATACRADGTAMPFRPFAEILRRVLDLPRDAPEPQVQEAVARLDPEGATRGHSLLTLLGRPGDRAGVMGEAADTAGETLRQTITDLILRSCRDRPLVLILEDMDKADTGTLQMLERLLMQKVEVPLMLLASSGSGFHPGWLMQARTTRVQLGPLGEAAVKDLVVRASGCGNLPSRLTARAAAQADGNPLYAVEIGRFLGQQARIPPQQDMPLPPTLPDTIMARVGALGPRCRALVQAASVIGEDFDAAMARDIASAICSSGPDPVAQAESAGVILPYRSGYRFQHAAVREAVYAALPDDSRRVLHARAAEAMARKTASPTAQTSLADHFERAGKPAEAVPHLIAAGRHALGLFLPRMAVDLFDRAARLIEDTGAEPDPALTGTFYSTWFEALLWRAEFGRVVTLFETMRARIDRAKGQPSYPRILVRAATAYDRTRQPDAAGALFAQVRARGEGHGDTDAVALGCLGLMGRQCAAPAPGYRDALRRLSAQCEGLWDGAAPAGVRTRLDLYRAWSHTIRGDIDLAAERARALYDAAKAGKSPDAMARGAACLAATALLSDDFDRAVRLADEGAEAAGGTAAHMAALALKGHAMTLRGNPEGGEKLLTSVRAEGVRLGYRTLTDFTCGSLGVARALRGDLSGGVTALTGAARQASATGNAHGAGMAYIALGALYLGLARGDGKPAFSKLAGNMGFLLREAPFARSRALAHFDSAASLGRAVGMHGVTAQALHGRAMVLLARRRRGAARAALQQAQAVVADIRWSHMDRRIRTDLAALA
ncbi:hypothetical protein FIU94_09510 [Sulfitobacter sp. THAF37]|uniref:ATP-binding protein n=1 Tax=Sulfitobacter sp. THAF37 TaxID=2587855 RepID=UPI0012A96529|nr:AAA family ATPase [Sulfitobacter sp. THAF37]QFT59060.1 hypothetical protein FIU94_09510 [Sulfitobacter sp. THAF37]